MSMIQPTQGTCVFCGRECYEEAWCFGCQAFVCAGCDLFTRVPPQCQDSTHDVMAHRPPPLRDLFPDDEGDDEPPALAMVLGVLLVLLALWAGIYLGLAF